MPRELVEKGVVQRFIVCNYAEASSHCSKGSLCYVTGFRLDSRRVQLLARSRSSRWICKWDKVTAVTNFRLKTLPTEHPLHSDMRLPYWNWEVGDLAALIRMAEDARERAEKRRLLQLSEAQPEDGPHRRLEPQILAPENSKETNDSN